MSYLSRYIFHGAEVYAEDLSDSEDEMGDEEESDQEQGKQTDRHTYYSN